MIKWVLLLVLCMTNVVFAGISITGTRVIYPSNEKVVAVNLNNDDDEPSLIQAWIEYPKTDATKKVPFIITPMVGRVEPKTEQSLRIRQVGADLPKDRESLFYLNVLEVPAKPKEAGDHYVQTTVRSTLKFFYRPSKLPYPVKDAYDKVTWHWANKTLTLNNPTPYYITYAGVMLRDDERVLYETSDIDMVAPFGTLTVDAPSDEKPNEIDWYIINDYGATRPGKSTIQ